MFLPDDAVRVAALSEYVGRWVSDLTSTATAVTDARAVAGARGVSVASHYTPRVADGSVKGTT
jgi:hypothetical protein